MKMLRHSLPLLLLSTLAPTAQAQWSSANLSDARLQLSSEAVGSKVLFAGGYTTFFSGVPLSTSLVDIYDAATDSWSVQQLSSARAWMASATIGNKAFFACGERGGANPYSNEVDVYDSSTNSWSSMSIPTGRYGCAAVSLDDKLYIAGGFSAGFHSVIDIYDDSTGTWSTALLSEARGDLAAAAVGQEVLFAGGWSNSGASAVVDIYDTSTSSWSTATLSVPRERLSAVTLGHKVFFAGGGDFTPGLFSTVDIYDSSTNSWSTATLSAPREFIAATAVGPIAMFAGGFDGSAGAPSDVVDIYDSRSGLWSTQSLAVPRWGMAAATLAGTAYFAGGNGLFITDDVNIYTTPDGVGTIYCVGNLGVDTACPCGNDNDGSFAIGAGCANSTFNSGVQLLAGGMQSVTLGNLELKVSGVPPNQPGLFFQGINAVNSGAGNLFGDGLRCAAGSVIRLQVVAANALGEASSTVDVAAKGGVLPGDLKRYQFWYRDPAGSPCAGNFNTSNGLEISWFNQ